MAARRRAGYRNWTQHPNNPMSKTTKVAEPAE